MADAAEARMLEIFQSMDEDGSGTVEIKELKGYIKERTVSFPR